MESRYQKLRSELTDRLNRQRAARERAVDLFLHIARELIHDLQVVPERDGNVISFESPDRETAGHAKTVTARDGDGYRVTLVVSVKELSRDIRHDAGFFLRAVEMGSEVYKVSVLADAPTFDDVETLVTIDRNQPATFSELTDAVYSKLMQLYRGTKAGGFVSTDGEPN